MRVGTDARGRALTNERRRPPLRPPLPFFPSSTSVPPSPRPHHEGDDHHHHHYRLLLLHLPLPLPLPLLLLWRAAITTTTSRRRRPPPPLPPHSPPACRHDHGHVMTATRGDKREEGGAAQARVGGWGLGCSCLQATPSHLLLISFLFIIIPVVGSIYIVYIIDIKNKRGLANKKPRVIEIPRVSFDTAEFTVRNGYTRLQVRCTAVRVQCGKSRPTAYPY